ncbi:MAG: 2-C-methyl-D-erythritol 2,4-cyclodiphosphate synthase [Clostridia bacterium]|nr:2-C-methyl-D-erythritol 2,4-cyclodiphosphate synthase [Clostridia bacterium]
MNEQNFQKPNITAIICAAGKGNRAMLNENKMFAVMPNGKSVLENALYPFDCCERVSEIIITANEEDINKITEISKTLSKPCLVVLGGETRFESVENAVEKASGSALLIHDGARPYIAENAVNECIDALIKHKSAVLCAPCTDTIIELNDNGLIESSSRENKLLAQTPQCFYKKELITAYLKRQEGEVFTDEAGLYSKYIEKPYPVVFNGNNKKLTHPNDFLFSKNLKVGTGFDLHTLVKNRKLILGGIEIEHDKGLLGHSDADVLTHAVMDALLSALALRDIGYHFSDKNPEYKDISSMLLLQRVMQMVNEKGYKVNNLSAVIMAEKPKLSPYIPQITASLASALKVSESDIGITCTTTEKIGLVGREEGIAVSAFCSVVKKQ